MGGCVKVLIHKLLMEMKVDRVIWKCKLATASRVKNMVTVYRTQVYGCVS